MQRSVLLSLFSFVLIILSACTPDGPPNVVFILVDDLGWSDLGVYGSTFHQTPNLDRLATSSTLFTDAYSASPVCSPTRAALMTGKHPVRLNITDWIPGADPKNRKLLGPQDLHELPLAEMTLAEQFKSAGYRTFFAGKWHLGGEGFWPEQQGFDINKGGHDKGSPPGGYYAPYNNPALQDGPEGEYLPDRLTNEAIDFMKASKEVPFFLYLSFYTVHTPIQASKRHLQRFEEQLLPGPDSLRAQLVEEHDGYTVTRQYNAPYASMVYAMDENIGRLLDALEENNLVDNTIVVFTSDNGGLSTLGPHRRVAPTSVRPLRAGKGWCYEGGIRIPLMIRLPGQRRGYKNSSPVISMDLYPTLLQLTGIMPPISSDGTDLSPVLKSNSKQLTERDLFWHFPHYHGSAWTPGSGLRSGPWKIIRFYETNEVELYNLDTDLGETNNLAASNPELLRELTGRLDSLLGSMNGQLPTVNEINMSHPEF